VPEVTLSQYLNAAMKIKVLRSQLRDAEAYFSKDAIKLSGLLEELADAEVDLERLKASIQ
jgi:hypothetical protein